MKNIVHIVGTGTIGEPLIGLFTDFADKMNIDEVTFHKRTPLHTDKSRLEHLMARGARLAVGENVRSEFEALGHKVSLDSQEALERATVVIDCTPAGNRNKEQYYSKLDGPRGFLAQGSEFGFGRPYARGINDEILVPGEDRFLQIVSCNTHNITTLVKTLCGGDDGSLSLDRARFVCIRRANDITQSDSFIPSPQVGKHGDARFGTHHARDAAAVFQTLDLNPDLFSSALKVNTQYMHSIWFNFETSESDLDTEEVIRRLQANARVALTEKLDANLIFSFGRDHGYYGRILSQTVVATPTLAVRDGEIFGFCFTPQDGNSLLSSVAAALWLVDPDPDSVRERLSPLRRWLYTEI